MPKKLQKSLHDYLTKMKKPTPHIQFPSNSFSSSKNWILSGCKHPKTLSFAIDSNQDKAGINDDDDDDDDDNDDHDDNNKGAATLSDIDRFLLENFKSLYINEHEDIDNNGKRGKEKHEGEKPVLFGSPRLMDPSPDICGSHRFFITPSLSSSLIEEARMSVSTTSEDVGSTSTSTSTTQNDHTKGKGVMLPDDSIAVLAYSPSPYDDFRRSMQEIVEARMRNHGKVDWDFMEELLFCYLNLNEKKSYRYILSAFVDLIIVLRQNSDRIPERSRNVRTLRMIERERRRKMRRK
ncbi:transcription repressor OFP14 [Fagus crenata]